MSKKVLLVFVLVWGMVSTSYGVVVGDFEDAGLDGWWSNDATLLSQSATGATLGASAMQVDVPGEWKMAVMMDAKPHMATMAQEGAVISADLTVSATDGTWGDVEIVINCQDNDANGVNNNLGWNSLGGQGLVSDGSTNSYQWTIGSALAAKIAGADSNIVWFEVVIVTNNDANSLSLNVDNVQIGDPATSAVIGNFEDAGLDGWYAGATLSQGAVGVTLDSSSMKIVAAVVPPVPPDDPDGWQTVAILDAHPWITLMGTGVQISADITVIDADLVGSDWLQAQMVVNGEAENGYTVGWNELGFQDLVRDGQPYTYTWDISPGLSAVIAGTDQGIGWFEIFFVTNMDGTGTGVTLYIDNIRLYQPEAPECDAPVGAVIGDFEVGLDGWGAWDATFTQSATGATLGAMALQSDIASGNWHGHGALDAKPHLDLLGSGVSISMDVTVFDADMDGDWMNVELVINAQDSDGDGGLDPQNNIGWKSLGTQDPLRDGVPHTYTWVLSDAMTAAIAAADSNIWWFELVIVTNNNASSTRIYVDNINISLPEPVTYPYGTLVGDFETGLDGWVQWDAPTFEQSETGATKGCNALKVVIDPGYHGTGALNIGPYFDMLAAGARIAADITVFPGDYDPAWGGMQMLINRQDEHGFNWVGMDPWVDPIIADGLPRTYTWVPSDAFRADMAADGLVGWFELVILTNNGLNGLDPTFTFYVDNVWIYIPAKASNPSPVDGATDVDCIPTLGWMPGGGALAHDVFVGTDPAALAAVNRDNLGSYPGVLYFNTEETTLDLSKLELDTIYYWRVDEIEDVNETMIVTGDIWNFEVANNINFEDFESYVDTADLQASWNDANTLSTDIVNNGGGAMHLTANNTKSPYYSEATMTLPDYFADLTQDDMAVMELYFRGDPNNSPESLYVRVVNSAAEAGVKVYPGDPADIELEEWQVWRITLDDFGIDLSDVVTVSIGFGDRESPSAGGRIWDAYIDDIRLFPARCLLELRDPDFAAIDYAPTGPNPGDCIIDFSEVMVMAADWLKTDAILATSLTDPSDAGGRVARYSLDEGTGTVVPADGNDLSPQGTLTGAVTWISPGYDGTGSAVNVDGVGDDTSRIDCGTWDPSAGTGQLSLSAWIRWSGDQTIEHQGIIGKRTGWSDTGAMKWFFETTPAGELALRTYDEGVFTASGILNPFIGKWAHVAVSFDGTTGVIYLNGAEVGSGPFEFDNMDDAGIGIGAVHGGGGEPFVGDIDEVQIFNRALSAEEVAYLADLTQGDGEHIAPIGSVADIVSDEAPGQKSINLKDLAGLASWWMETDLAVVFN